MIKSRESVNRLLTCILYTHIIFTIMTLNPTNKRLIIYYRKQLLDIHWTVLSLPFPLSIQWMYLLIDKTFKLWMYNYEIDSTNIFLITTDQLCVGLMSLYDQLQTRSISWCKTPILIHFGEVKSIKLSSIPYILK